MADTHNNPWTERFDSWTIEQKMKYIQEAMNINLLPKDINPSDILKGEVPLLSRADMESLKKELEKLI